MASIGDHPDHIDLSLVAHLPAEQGLGLARQRLDAGEPTLIAARDALLAAAEQSLGVPPQSVIDDDAVAPSGDKHDFFSFGPYWWPDPDKPDGLPYIRRDGERNPDATVGDHAAMSTTGHHVTLLTLAWSLSGDERFARHAGAMLRRFFLDPTTGMRPHLEYAQAIPGRCTGRNIGLIDTHWLVNPVETVALLDGAPGWPAEDAAALRDWFRAYLDWFITSDHGQREAAEHNNHGTWWDAQAVAFALFVGDEQTARQVLETVAERRIDAQLQPDGSQPHELARTLSFTYSVFNLQALTALAVMGRRVGIDLWSHVGPDGQSLGGAIRFYEPFVDAPDSWAWQQIKPKQWGKLAAICRLAAICQGDGAFEAMVRRMPGMDQRPDALQLLYPTPA